MTPAERIAAAEKALSCADEYLLPKNQTGEIVFSRIAALAALASAHIAFARYQREAGRETP